MRNKITKILLIIALLTFEISVAQKNNEKSIYNKIESVESMVIRLKSQNDSLNKKLNTIEKNDYKSFEVIDRVNNYYENAWNKLIYFITAIGGILIFVIPYILSRLQKREINLNKEEYQEYVDSKVSEFEKKIVEFNEKETIKIRKEINELNENINNTQDEKIAKLYAMTFYLQGLHSINDNNPDLTIKSFTTTIKNLLKANTNENLKLALDNISYALDKKIKSKEKLTEEVDKSLNEIIVEINEKFQNSFVDEISKLKEKITTANNV